MMRMAKPLMCAILLAQVVSAEPIDDARIIVEKTVTRDQFDAAFVAMADLLLGSMQNESAKSGKPLSDDAAQVVVQMLTERMVDGMLEQMREPLAQAYMLNLSPEAISAYRRFLETDEGSEVAAITPTIMLESMKIGQEIGKNIATDAVNAMIADIEADNWPSGTLKSTQAELRSLYSLPSAAEMPPER
tara:strand:- start:44 stop:610 length:567 start_codon:yes stop_codon:yes gene_type:complete